MIPSKFPRSFSFKPVTLAIAGAYFSAQSVGVVMAQNAAVLSLPTVTVTAQALGAGVAAVPSTVLAGAQLTVQKEATLGETLPRELGVSTTGFGANASRPVIRGLDADRIKLLNNGATSHDVSGLSFDHASPIDPLVVQRIEALRGPATLLFGGGAVGGVINAIDNRIPSERIDGLSGTVELRGDTAQRGGSASAVIATALTKDWMLHVDAFKRRSASTRVPVELACTINSTAVLEKKVCNTHAQSNGGAFGLSRVWADGFVGVSLDTYRSDYGTPAEVEVTIDMKRDTLSLKGEQRQLIGPIKSIAAQINATNYKHTELDAGLPATQFSKRGEDAKLTLTQRDWLWGNSTLTGTHLISVDKERFSALGDEAFVPQNTQRQMAIATVQTLKTNWGSVNAGARLEQVTIASKGGDQVDYSGIDKFSVVQRRFTPKNLALSGVVNLSQNTQLTASLASSQRAPSAAELFANGAHVATAAYEVGDSQLSKERSNNLDLSMQWRDGKNSFKVGGFYNRFRNYISLNNSGTSIGADGNPVTLDADGDGADDVSGESILAKYNYQAVGARFIGLEAQGQMRVMNQPYTLDVYAKFDTLSAINTATGEALPRIAPMRLTLAAVGRYMGWSSRVEWAHNAQQSKVPANDLMGATPAYSMVNLRVDYRSQNQPDALWFFALDNALNKVAFNAVTIDTIRGKAPLAGRRLKLGVQYAF